MRRRAIPTPGIVIMAAPAGSGWEIIKYQLNEKLSTVNNISATER